MKVSVPGCRQSKSITARIIVRKIEDNISETAVADLQTQIDTFSTENPELLDDEITSVYRKDLFIPETEWEACRKRLQDIWAEVDQLWTLLK
jgi:hypothetical protein